MTGVFVAGLVVAGCGGSGDVPAEEPEHAATTYASTQEFRAAAAEYSHRMIACFDELGWSARIDHLGRGYEVESVTAQNRESFMVAQAECEDRIGPAPQQAPPDAEQLAAYYESSIAVKDCLEEQGYSITDPPSLETFRADYESFISGGDRAPWDPWSDIDAVALGQAAFEELETICPEPGW